MCGKRYGDNMDINYKNLDGILIPMQSSIVEYGDRYTKFSNGIVIGYWSGTSKDGIAVLSYDTSKNCFYFNIAIPNPFNSSNTTIIYEHATVNKLTGTKNGSSVTILESSTTGMYISRLAPVYTSSSIRITGYLSGDTVSNYSDLFGYYSIFIIGKWK